MQAVRCVVDNSGDNFANNQPDGPNAHRALMARIAATRDRKAFRSLFEFFGPRVKSLMMKAGADHAFADDLVQDVMMTVWRKVELYAPDRGTVSAWIFTIARNARIDRLRKSSSQPYDDIDEVHIESGEKSAEETVISGQHRARVAIAMSKLSDDQKSIIELSYLHDVPQSEIAERLAIPLGTVKSRMRLAYAKLRVELEDLQ